MLFRSNDTATTEIYTEENTLSLHDALPISVADADDGAVIHIPMPCPVGTVSTAPVVGAVIVIWAPACPGACTAKAVIDGVPSGGYSARLSRR